MLYLILENCRFGREANAAFADEKPQGSGYVVRDWDVF
jgi:hypothetical protein